MKFFPTPTPPKNTCFLPGIWDSKMKNNLIISSLKQLTI